MMDVMDCIKTTYPHPAHPVRCDGGRALDGHDQSLSNRCTSELRNNSQVTIFLTIEEKVVSGGNTLHETLYLFPLLWNKH